MRALNTYLNYKYLTATHQHRHSLSNIRQGTCFLCVTKLMKSISQSSGRAVNHNNNNKGCSLGHKAQVAATGGQRCEAQSHSSPQLAPAYEIWEPRAEIPEPRELGTANSELRTRNPYRDQDQDQERRLLPRICVHKFNYWQNGRMADDWDRDRERERAEPSHLSI